MRIALLANLAKTVTTRTRSWASDLVVLAGLGLLAFGLGQYSPPLAPIVIGLGLIVTVGFGSHD
jgi:hypothetical protein